MNLYRSRVGVIAASWALAAGAALAQGAAAPAAPAKDSKEAREAREAAEAMERARRLAANPMRVILEASRVRRRADGEPAPQLVPVSSGSGVAAAAAPAPAPAAPEVQPRAVAPSPREAPAPEAASAVISSELAQARTSREAAPALDAGTLPKPVRAPEVALPAPATLLPGITNPTLVSRVDPELPARLLTQLEPNTVVAAELSIRPDGSVSQVNVVSPNARAMARFIVEALMQWRFAPLPAERQWRVDLLFRPES